MFKTSRLHSEEIGGNRGYYLEAYFDKDDFIHTLVLTKMIGNKEIWDWDVKEWLINELFPMLKIGVESDEMKRLNQESGDEFPIGDYTFVLEIMLEAEKLGWFK